MAETTTPMMSQYLRIKKEVPPDTILFFRLGDFYEMFFDDAKEASRILEITLTRRNGVPMCGVPFHAAENYLARLIRAGKKVAICDQVEDASAAKGIVKREVTRVVTPGTTLDDGVLDSNRNNWLAGLCRNGNLFGLAMLDLSTGAFWIEECHGAGAVQDNFTRCQPSECVIPESQADDPELKRLCGPASRVLGTQYEDWTFEFDMAEDLLLRHFGVHSLEGYGCDGCRSGVGAAGAVLHYVTQELHRKAGHVRDLKIRRPEGSMLLDEATIVNLELLQSRSSAPSAQSATLLRALDSTRTSMGARLLRDWLIRPLRDDAAIGERHDALDAFCKDRLLLTEVRDVLAEVKDLERLLTRLSSGSGNARDLRAVACSLTCLPPLRAVLEAHACPVLADAGSQLDPLPEVTATIDQAIADEPSAALREGGMIRVGYHAELDALRTASSDGKRWLADFQAQEQARTGIKSLKVRHNQVFGYYIEITKSNLDQAPANYIRKQTLVNAERFITPELKEYENRIFGAEERADQLEYELFCEVRDKVVAQTAAIQKTASAVARLDVLAALAERALANRYVRPVINQSGRILIRDGRHPVIELISESERFVPNDTLLDTESHHLHIITGPNMAGKSTYIRQVALIVIMAQIGSFVPASEAEIGLVDRVFTRVGASDDLARGRSTFMVEMQETANILNNATPQSLIVLDEIGRGTSTFDGISIAWAVAEHLHNTPSCKAKTLFATHYHELTDLALTLRGVQNFNVLVKEKGDQIVFLRKIGPGAADKSYGIAVGRLAGLPAPVIERAQEILKNLEESEFEETGQPKLAQQRGRRKGTGPGQLSFFN